MTFLAQFGGDVASAAIDRGEVLIAGMAAMLITIFLGPRFIEYLRGAMAPLIMDRPVSNLVPRAKALNAIDNVLAIHLGALEAAAGAAGAASDELS